MRGNGPTATEGDLRYRLSENKRYLNGTIGEIFVGCDIGSIFRNRMRMDLKKLLNE